jgi:hypothetical protein
MREVAMPAAQRASVAPASVLRRLVGDDRGARAGPQRGDARAQRLQHAAADDDVIGALAERDIDGDRIGMFQRRGHRAAPIDGGWLAARRKAARAARRCIRRRSFRAARRATRS